MREIIQKFLDERDLGRPMDCGTCPVKSICKILAANERLHNELADECRNVWAEIKGWVEEGEATELNHFLKVNT